MNNIAFLISISFSPPLLKDMMSLKLFTIDELLKLEELFGVSVQVLNCPEDPIVNIEAKLQSSPSLLTTDGGVA